MLIHVDDMIKSSFRLIGVLGKGEAPTDDEYTDALEVLNYMISSWSIRNLMLLGSVMEGFPITAGIYQYLIGIGQTFNTIKPSKITIAYVRDSNGNDFPVTITEQQTYSAFTDKSIGTGTPSQLYFDPGLTQQAIDVGTIDLYPPPNKDYTLYIGETKPLTEFTAITDVVTFHPAYYEAIRYELAIRLYREYHEHNRPIPEDILGLARTAVKSIETMNAKQVLASMDFPGRYSTFNIYTGDNN